MKKINIYFLNDGKNGVVLAKSKKHVAKLIKKYYKKISFNEIFTRWDIYKICSWNKKKQFKKSRVAGFFK